VTPDHSTARSSPSAMSLSRLITVERFIKASSHKRHETGARRA
jgi:hypothetical protein